MSKKDDSGITVCQLAASHGRTETLRFLLKKRAVIEEAKEEKKTVLHIAAAEGYYEAVHEMREEGVDVNVKDINDRTPLHNAADTEMNILMDYSRVVTLLIIEQR